jgi:protein-L-isoaspartate(D-aspartate) O-methyltransferase
MIQHPELEDGHFVLDNATATGYRTAVVAAVAKSVVGLDCDAVLAEEASKTLDESAIEKVVIVKGRSLEGDPHEVPTARYS